jgi:hypothetical protein
MVRFVKACKLTGGAWLSKPNPKKSSSKAYFSRPETIKVHEYALTARGFQLISSGTTELARNMPSKNRKPALWYPLQAMHNAALGVSPSRSVSLIAAQVCP